LGGRRILLCRAFHPTRDGVIYFGRGDVGGVYKRRITICINDTDGLATMLYFGCRPKQSGKRSICGNRWRGCARASNLRGAGAVVSKTKELGIIGQKKRKCILFCMQDPDGNLAWRRFEWRHEESGRGQSWDIKEKESARWCESGHFCPVWKRSMAIISPEMYGHHLTLEMCPGGCVGLTTLADLFTQELQPVSERRRIQLSRRNLNEPFSMQ